MLSVFVAFQIWTNAPLTCMVAVQIVSASTLWAHSPANATQVRITTATAKHVIRTVSLTRSFYYLSIYLLFYLIVIKRIGSNNLLLG